MMRGEVRQNSANGLEAWLEVRVEGADGIFYLSEAVVDTGFTGDLMLPDSMIQRLGLTAADQTEVVLATGEVRRINYYFTRIFWQGEVLPVTVFQSQDQSLLGMQLLRDNIITIHARDGGEVTIIETTPES